MTSWVQNQNTRQKSVVFRSYFSLSTFNIAIICLLVAFGFLYLTQVNALAVQGYVLRDLETKLEDYKLNNRNLEIQNQAKQSVSNLKDKVTQLGMVNADQVEYLQAPGGKVAVAR